MDAIHRVLSRPVNKPYRTKHLQVENPPFLTPEGHVGFGPGDVENPQNWSTPRRWAVSISAVSLVLNATFASSAPSGCLISISEHFGVSNIVAGLTITVFLLGYVAGPLIFAPLSEFYGRRWIFYISFLCYIAFNFLCAFAPNFASLLVGRFLTGTFVAAPLSNSPGVLADVWNPLERGDAMAGFACMVYLGPALGPVVGGFLELDEDWRWIFYVLLWLGAITLIPLFTIPETYAPTVLTHKARRIREAKIEGYENVQSKMEADGSSLGQMFKVALTRPWIILFDPISLLCAVYMSIVYTLLYMLFSIYPIVFQERRGWNSGVGELPLIGSVVGAIIGGCIVLIDTRLRVKKIESGQKKMSDFEAEDFLAITMIGGVGFPITMFWFAWTANYDSIHWIVPTLAGVFLSTSLLLIFVGFLNYLVQSYLMFAASAIAANTITRSACGAAAPLFTNQMFSALGIGPGGSLIAGVGTLLAVIPFLFYKYGKQIRIKSKFAPARAAPVVKQDEESAPAAEGGPLEPTDDSRSSTDVPDTVEKTDESGGEQKGEMAKEAGDVEASQAMNEKTKEEKI